jgi:hypothetical protein
MEGSPPHPKRSRKRGAMACRTERGNGQELLGRICRFADKTCTGAGPLKAVAIVEFW